MPPRCYDIQATDRIKSYLREHPQGCKKLGIAPEDEVVDMDKLITLVGFEKEIDAAERTNINDLLSESTIVTRYVSTTPQAGKSEMDLVRERAQERRYQRSIGGLQFIRDRKLPSDAYGNYRTSLAMGVNSIMGLFLMFLAGYWGSQYCGVTDLKIKVFVGLGLSVMCLLIEVTLLIAYDEKQRLKKGRMERIERLKASALVKEGTAVTAKESGITVASTEEKESGIDAISAAEKESSISATSTPEKTSAASVTELVEEHAQGELSSELRHRNLKKACT